jgi:mannitol/fructose-specific phosphotransferase system IIA component (Ntr-type)
MEESLARYSHLLPPSSVLVPLKARTKRAALDELFSEIGLLRHLDAIHKLKEAVLRRECECSTGIGHGIAIAHGKCEGLTDIFLCLGVSYGGVDYGSCDGRPVHLLFVAANPPAMHDIYLEMLACLTRFLRNDSVRERLVGREAHILRELLHQALVPGERSFPISA